ncbi:MAG: YrrC family ATP-dependent DNA helicase, partial [Chloroflexota bacterium]
MVTVVGSIDRMVFSNPENGFLVARFQLLQPADLVEPIATIVGTMPSVHVGEILRVSGDWQTHPIHGRNFRVDSFEPEMPDSREGIERFLGSGAIRGIG